MSATTSTPAAASALAILEAFLEQERAGFADDRQLHREARTLSEEYTSTDEARSLGADAAASLAYLAHFGPRAIAAVSHALAFTSVPAHCVDVGAGSGASALPLLIAGARKLTLVDPSTKALAMAMRLLAFASARLAAPLDVRTVAVSAASAVPMAARPVGRDELVLSAFAFGELPGEAADALATLASLAPQARAVVVVDAGDRARARRLQTARDSFVAANEIFQALSARGLRVRAPCPHREPCPALVRERDWCHARIDKGLPGKLARFSRAVGRDDERMSLTFLVLDDRPQNDTGIVVIGDALAEKGRVRLPVCGPGGLRFLQALTRDRQAHDALLEIPRGARLPLQTAVNAREGTAHVTEVHILGRSSS